MIAKGVNEPSNGRKRPHGDAVYVTCSKLMHLATACLVALNVQIEAVCLLREGLRLAIEDFMMRLTPTMSFLLTSPLIVSYSFVILLAAP
jgi:hypothetical protein